MSGRPKLTNVFLRFGGLHRPQLGHLGLVLIQIGNTLPLRAALERRRDNGVVLGSVAGVIVLEDQLVLGPCGREQLGVRSFVDF